MKINASVGRAPKNVSLNDECLHLKLDAQTKEEAAFLAWLYRSMLKLEDISVSEFRRLTSEEAAS